jgi:hypothetical protein
VFEPQTVTAEDVVAAFERINRVFYSWSGIAKRWWRFISAYLETDWSLKKLTRSTLVSYIFFKISIFQRHHAQKKVYEKVGDRAVAVAGETRAPNGTLKVAS